MGRGGFGIVFKARHRLDGNIYAIKKIKLSDKLNSEENRRILREISYLSSLNNQYIVRYFQTWVERETSQEIIDQFEEWLEEDYDSEYDESVQNDDDSFEMKVVETDDEFSQKKAQSRLISKRSSSYDKGPLRSKRNNNGG